MAAKLEEDQKAKLKEAIDNAIEENKKRRSTQTNIRGERKIERSEHENNVEERSMPNGVADAHPQRRYKIFDRLLNYSE